MVYKKIIKVKEKSFNLSYRSLKSIGSMQSYVHLKIAKKTKMSDFEQIYIIHKILIGICHFLRVLNARNFAQDRPFLTILILN